MSSTVLTQLAGAMRTYLEEQFTTGGDEALAFEPFGVPVDPDTFRAGPQGSFNSVLVAEHLTRLTDKVGQLVDGQFHKHWVASQVFGALMGSTVQAADMLAAFGAVKGPAEQAYRSANPTFQSKAMPDNWYDISAVGNWTIGHTVSSVDVPAGQPLPPVPNSRIGRMADKWQLRLVAPEDQQTLAALSNPTAMLAVAPLKRSSTEILSRPGTPLAAMETATEFHTRSMETTPVVVHELLGKTAFAATPATFKPALMVARPVEERISNSDVGLAGGLAATETTGTPIILTRSVKEIMADPEMVSGVLAGIDSNATAHEVVTSSLTLSFDLCAVSIDRDWWSWLLIRMPGWTLPPFSPGQLVPGLSAESSDVVPPCGLPSTMLLIKNLQISGWASADLDAVARSSSLGPFSFAGGKEVVNGTLSAPGIHVFGWVCDIIPPLPPVQAS